MTKITEKKLIQSLSQLKEIKPNQEWASLLKSQILEENQAEEIIVNQPARWVGIREIFSSVFSNRRLSYSLAVLLFFVVGIFGFAKYTVPGDILFPVKKLAEQSQASLTGQTGLQNNISNLSSRVNDLAMVAKAGRKDNLPSAISEVNANVSQLVKDLKNNPTQDSKTIKEIANSLKVLADMQGTDLSANPDVKDLYQTVVQSQIADLQKTTLTDDQKNTLIQVEDLANQGKYYEAFEKILLINNLP